MKKRPSPLVQLARYSTLAFLLPASTVAGYLIGAALDHWLGTGFFTVPLLLVGIAAGFIKLAREVSRGDGS
ncbi:MAG: AtpZ/AtpI family protein [Acidobacteria bacterium]|nr:AtpZ/AtpI family protein [Acidobacteriota bacterium]